MRKFETFFKQIADVRSGLRDGNVLTTAKSIIGASQTNNRTLTVNQTVQYLSQVGKPKLARQLRTALNVMRGHIKEHRNQRTDAIDLAEFVRVYRKVVMNRRDAFMRRRIGHYLNRAE